MTQTPPPDLSGGFFCHLPHKAAQGRASAFCTWYIYKHSPGEKRTETRTRPKYDKKIFSKKFHFTRNFLPPISLASTGSKHPAKNTAPRPDETTTRENRRAGYGTKAAPPTGGRQGRGHDPRHAHGRPPPDRGQLLHGSRLRRAFGLTVPNLTLTSWPCLCNWESFGHGCLPARTSMASGLSRISGCTALWLELP